MKKRLYLTNSDSGVPVWSVSPIQYLVQSDFEPFPFQSGRIMARFQSVKMKLYFQMSVKRRSSHGNDGGST